jgi:hypothetical protein
MVRASSKNEKNQRIFLLSEIQNQKKTYIGNEIMRV